MRDAGGANEGMSRGGVGWMGRWGVERKTMNGVCTMCL